MIKNLPTEQAELKAIVESILKTAKAKGASAAEVSASCGMGLDVNVRLGDVETVEHNQGRGFDVTVFVGHKKGYASTSDTRPAAIEKVVEAALSIAKYTEEDPCSGLADPASLAADWPTNLALHHPENISVEQATARALACEKLALSLDKRVTNSEGASFGMAESVIAYGNSNGFYGAYPSSRYSLDCSVIVEKGDEMHRDYGYTTARALSDLWDPETVAKEAVERTVNKLGSKQIETTESPVIFRSDVARSLIGHFLSAISGGALYRQQSFMEDSLGKMYFPEWLSVREDPYVPKGFGSSPYDAEGVAVQKRHLLDKGVVQGYLLGSYSARKLGMTTTGNSGGAHNIFVTSQDLSDEALLKKMGTGLFVTDLIGQGVNLITGDYSRGASGFWVENGKIQFPVEEITIASNLKEMFMKIEAVSQAIDPRSAIHVGSILIKSMTLAGS